jgi:hypothetical protein
MKTWRADLAKWIWVKGDERPDNAYFQFRKSFSLDSVPDQAKIHLTADCKYLLYLNGVAVGRGPITSDPKYKQVDTYEVSSLLHPGKNAVCVQVLQRNARTSRIWPVRGGMLLQFDSDALSFGSSAGWAARRAIEYKRDVPRMTPQYGHQEWVDGRLAEAVWLSVAYDDTFWERAVEVAQAEQYWPGDLIRRPLPHLVSKTRRPVKPLGYFSIQVDPSHPYAEPAIQMMKAYVGSSVKVVDYDHLARGPEYPTQIVGTSMNSLGFVVDFGEETYGYPYIDFECPEGVTVDLGHAEILSRNRVQPYILGHQSFADRYVSRAGRQRWELFDTKGFRYLEVHFDNIPRDAEGTTNVTIFDIGVIERSWPVKDTTSFASSDSQINDIFRICKRTVEVKHQDWHICDAQREQNQWPEFIQAWVYGQYFGGSALVHTTIDNFVKAQMSCGQIPATVPPIPVEGWNEKNNYLFATYGLPFMGWIDWLYGGEKPLHKEWLPAFQKIFDYFFSFADEYGMPHKTPSNHWIEWTGIDSRPSDVGRPVHDDWRVTYLSAFFAIVLDKTADMAASLGETDLALTWREKAASIRRRCSEIFWDGKTAYVDGIYDGRQSDSTSCSSNAMITLAQAGAADRLKKAMAYVMDPANNCVMSAINNTCFLHEALDQVEMSESALANIRRIWSVMLENGATTTWEDIMAPERSMGMCFGFAAHPIIFFVRNFLGIIPTGPAYKTFTVRLHPCDLTWARGKTATPSGDLTVDWNLENQMISMVLTVPAGCTAHVALPRLTAGEMSGITVNGVQAELKEMQIATSTLASSRLPAVALTGGVYHIRFN